MIKAELYCKDVLDFLKERPDESIDLIVTDPPYNSQAISWDMKDDAWQFKWLEETKRALRIGGSLYVFFAPMNMYLVEGWIRNNLTLKNVIVWHHANLYGSGMSYGKDRYKSTWDVVFYAVKGDKAKHGKNVSSVAYSETGRGFDVMIHPQPRPLLHKAQKPLDLIKRFIICSSTEDDLVIDPFVGVGTTCIAAELLGRKSIGNDNDEKFIRIAKRRLEEIDNLKEVDKVIWKEKRDGLSVCQEKQEGSKV